MSIVELIPIESKKHDCECSKQDTPEGTPLSNHIYNSQKNYINNELVLD